MEINRYYILCSTQLEFKNKKFTCDMRDQATYRVTESQNE